MVLACTTAERSRMLQWLQSEPHGTKWSRSRKEEFQTSIWLSRLVVVNLGSSKQAWCKLAEHIADTLVDSSAEEAHCLSKVNQCFVYEAGHAKIMTLRDHKYTEAGHVWLKLCMGIALALPWEPMRLLQQS